MRAESTEEIIRQFCELNAKGGGICSEWCVGVTEDAEHHLFEELGIPRDYPWCIHRCAASAKEARAIVEGFHNVGCEARFSRINGSRAVYVFAYRKFNITEKTIELKTAEKGFENRV
jgi:hypothetical protein